MMSVKRIEIVVDEAQMDRLTALLDRLGLPGYTLMRHVGGKGRRGTRSADELITALENGYVLIACTAEQADAVVEAVRPLLKRGGGMCLVSDAQWVVH